ncbi:MAG: DNA topoisomerase IB [Proteobacteria bacterium]|nr:DNA topoisomerase IB [Pseudomonadota bacterium]
MAFDAEKVGPAPEQGQLTYVNDNDPGITRRRVGKSFSYRSADGGLIKDAETLKRIRSLAIPPAYAEVWICPDPRGHIQATGRDIKGRKQYRYHPDWGEARGETKYHRAIEFARALPGLRDKIERDLSKPGLSKAKVVATVVRLLELTLIRVGNSEYAKQNKSFGLTTLRDRHVKVDGAEIRFKFKGKSGVEHETGLKDRRLARIVRASQDVAGQHLFQWVDREGQRHEIGSSDVNGYLREAIGEDFSAKDFRTWAGTVAAAQALLGYPPPKTATEAKKVLAATAKTVAARLGNTPAVSRKAYIHPAVFEAYTDGVLAQELKVEDPDDLLQFETALADFLVRREGKSDTRSPEAQAEAV